MELYNEYYGDHNVENMENKEIQIFGRQSLNTDGLNQKNGSSLASKDGNMQGQRNSTIDQATGPEQVNILNYNLRSLDNYKDKTSKFPHQIIGASPRGSLKTSPKRKKSSRNHDNSKKSLKSLSNSRSRGRSSQVSPIKYQRLKIGDVKDQSKRLKNKIKKQEDKPQPQIIKKISPVRLMDDKSLNQISFQNEYSLNPKNTQKLWRNFEISLTKQILGNSFEPKIIEQNKSESQQNRNYKQFDNSLDISQQNQFIKKDTLSEQSPIKMKFSNNKYNDPSKINSPKSKNWSPSSNHQNEQMLTNIEGTLNLFNQGVTEAIKKQAIVKQSPLRINFKNNKQKQSSKKRKIYSQKQDIIALGPTIKELQQNFGSELKNNILQNKQYKTSNLNEYFGDRNIKFNSFIQQFGSQQQQNHVEFNQDQSTSNSKNDNQTGPYQFVSTASRREFDINYLQQLSSSDRFQKYNNFNDEDKRATASFNDQENPIIIQQNLNQLNNYQKSKYEIIQNRYLNDRQNVNTNSRQQQKQLTTPPQIESSKNIKNNVAEENPHTFGGSKMTSPFIGTQQISNPPSQSFIIVGNSIERCVDDNPIDHGDIQQSLDRIKQIKHRQNSEYKQYSCQRVKSRGSSPNKVQLPSYRENYNLKTSYFVEDTDDINDQEQSYRFLQDKQTERLASPTKQILPSYRLDENKINSTNVIDDNQVLDEDSRENSDQLQINANQREPYHIFMQNKEQNQDQFIPRKKSPEELVESVNRKFSKLFGKNLVQIQNQKSSHRLPDTKNMDTQDFMNYLKKIGGNKQNEQQNEQNENVLQSYRQNKLIQNESIQKKSRLQFSQSNNKNKSSNKLRYRSLSFNRTFIPARNKQESLRKSSQNQSFKIIPKNDNINLKVSSFKSIQKLQNLQSWQRKNYSEVRTCADSNQFQKKQTLMRKNIHYSSEKQLLKGDQNQKQIGIRKIQGSFIENEWDRREISKLRYEEFKKDKEQQRRKQNPWKSNDDTVTRMHFQNNDQLQDQYQKVVLDIWKEVRCQQKQKRDNHTLNQLQANRKLLNYDSNLQLQTKQRNQIARIKAIQNKLKPFVFSRFSEYYKIYSNQEPNISLEKRIQALLLNEKILQNYDFNLMVNDIQTIKLRLLNAYMLLKTYSEANDHNRLIRFLQESTESNLFLPSLITKLMKTPNLGDFDLQNYVLFIWAIYGESLMKSGNFDASQDVFYQICKVYNRWKVNNRIAEQESFESSSQQLDKVLEFGVDDYIKAKANYAESIMNSGDIDHAIDKFENVKKTIENEIVYENPMLYVNICNQLGNCYLLKQNLQKAINHFQISLSMINKLQAEKIADAGMKPDILQFDKISPLVISKICLNIAIIRSQMGDHLEAVFMHEKSLSYKSDAVPQLNNEIRDQNILLAFAQQRAGMLDKACGTLERALAIQKSHNGEYNYKTAQLHSQVAQAYSKVQNLEKAIENYELSCMILLKLENDEEQLNYNQHINQIKPLVSGKIRNSQSKITLKLDKIYMYLVEMYLQMNMINECKKIIHLFEIRLESICNSDDYAYRMMNQLGNILQKNDFLDQSIIYYKKALLCMKRRHKNRFSHQPETAKILVNISQVQFVQGDLKESLKNYFHAINVYENILDNFDRFEGDISPFYPLYLEALSEKGKVHMSCADIFLEQNNKLDGINELKKGLYAFEDLQKKKELFGMEELFNYIIIDNLFLKKSEKVSVIQLIEEAKHSIKTIF